MGDHRASIKIEFTMHGVTSKTDMWINWWEGACSDLPSALRKFLAEAESKSMWAYYDAEYEIERKAAERRKALADQARAKLTAEEWAAIQGNPEGER